MTVSDYLLTAFLAARDARDAIPAKCHDCYVPTAGLPHVCIEHQGEYQDAYVAADRLWDVFWDEHEATTEPCDSAIGCCDDGGVVTDRWALDQGDACVLDVDGWCPCGLPATWHDLHP